MLRSSISRVAVACVAVVASTCAAVAQIPAGDGQVWKTYAIGPFVKQAGAGSQRYVVDWILQETGYPAWHGATPASLSADAEQLSCFHTPEMQAKVEEVVARFVEEADTPHRFTVRVLGLDSPAWRTEARPALTAISVATPGVQAWIAQRETAATVLARLRSRSDCHELPTGPVLAANGLPATLSGGRKQPYVQDVAPRPDVWPGWQTQSSACDEGLAIDVHPLISRDQTAVEAVIRCRIDQIERMAAVSLASPVNQQLVQVEVPQVAAVRVGERFRWPANQTLVIGIGLVPWPVPAQNVSPVALLSDVKRCDVVIVVEPRLGGGP
ncbi:MAG: hypothetical protein K8S94_10730 [Planctomycetia bacterium]|nr:hypothetical protein [Planctomycetia bacterium]